MICLAQMYRAQREILPVWVYQEAEIRALARDPRFRGCNPIDVFWIGLRETSDFLEIAEESPPEFTFSVYQEWCRFDSISRNRTEFHHHFLASQLGYILFRRDDDNRNILDAKWIKMSPIHPVQSVTPQFVCTGSSRASCVILSVTHDTRTSLQDLRRHYPLTGSADTKSGSSSKYRLRSWRT